MSTTTRQQAASDQMVAALDSLDAKIARTCDAMDRELDDDLYRLLSASVAKDHARRNALDAELVAFWSGRLPAVSPNPHYSPLSR